MENLIKVGDFIRGSYKCGCICGVVTQVKKSIVVIKKCKQNYNNYTLTDTLYNVTKSRIWKFGLEPNESIV
jgi:hypothetical protein